MVRVAARACAPGRRIAITRIAYYDRISSQWNRITGHHGGPFKRYVLNDRILARLDGLEGRAILELGAGNGYFAPLLMRRFSGQHFARLVISDQAQAQLDIARAEFRVDGAEYLPLDVQEAFPFPDASFDLILAFMLLNELTTTGLTASLRECRRALAPGGRLLAAITHPAFVFALGKKGALTDFGRGLFAMPGAEGIRLPVSRGPTQAYLDALSASGFAVETEDVFPDEKTLHARHQAPARHATRVAAGLSRFLTTPPATSLARPRRRGRPVHRARARR